MLDINTLYLELRVILNFTLRYQVSCYGNIGSNSHFDKIDDVLKTGIEYFIEIAQ